MKVLLVSPISDLWNERKHVPLGLGYLAAVMLQAGHEAQIFDAAVETEPLGRSAWHGSSFDVVGVTSHHAADLRGLGGRARGQSSAAP